MLRNIARSLYYLFKSTYIIIFISGINIRLSTKIKKLKKIARHTKIGANTYISGSLGKYSYIGNNCELNADIGNFCSIANNVKTIEGSHPTDRISTSPVFYSTQKQCGKSFAAEQLYDDIIVNPNGCAVSIGNDVWIGENVLIKGGITIGDGACIAMGAVVVKDIPPYSIVGGIPAKIIKIRFPEEKVKLLLESKWWLKSDSWLQSNWRLFSNPNEFFSQIK